MEKRLESGNLLVEAIILIVVVAVLAALAFPAMGRGGLRKGQETQTLSNMKQLHMATQQMALDGETARNTNLAWPGDRGSNFELWAADLVNGNYLSTNDVCKLLSAAGKLTVPGQLPTLNNNAVLLYAVSKTSPGDTVLFTTANFTNSPTGGLPALANAKPYGQKDFVVFHKAGDGMILQNRQTGPAYTNIIGSYVPLCK